MFSIPFAYFFYQRPNDWEEQIWGVRQLKIQRFLFILLKFVFLSHSVVGKKNRRKGWKTYKLNLNFCRKKSNEKKKGKKNFLNFFWSEKFFLYFWPDLITYKWQNRQKKWKTDKLGPNFCCEWSNKKKWKKKLF